MATACRTLARRVFPVSSCDSSMPAMLSSSEVVTEGDGRYALTPTTAGPFTLEVVVPAGYQPTLVDIGQDDGIDSDADPAKLVVGQAETTVRFAVGEAAGAEADHDIGLVAPPAEAPAPETTAAPTTTVAVEAPTTTAAPTTTIAPTTTVAPETTAPPTTAPAIPVPTEPAAAPTEEPALPEAPTTTAPAG